MKTLFSCLKSAVPVCLLLPVLASARWMPEQGEADTGLSVTLITSLHGIGAVLTEGDDGTPQGWPPAFDMRGMLVPATGPNGDFLYVAQRSGLLRVPPVPTSHYQVELPHPGYKDNNQNAGAVQGDLIQRRNGDLIGSISWDVSCIRAVGDEPRVPGINCKAHPVTGERMPDWELESPVNVQLASGRIERWGYGVLYRTEYDGVDGNLIGSIANQLHYPYGILVADGDIVYGMDRGTEGRTRLWRLNADDSLDFLFTFPQSDDGRNQVGNGFVITEDGWVYGINAYDAYGILTEPDTATAVVYRLKLDDPANSWQVLHTFTRKQGVVNDYHPLWSHRNSTIPTHVRDWVALNDGWLYGTVNKADDYPYGMVYRLRTDGSDFQVIHAFEYDAGAYPQGHLAIANGYLYGTTIDGGMHESPEGAGIKTPGSNPGGTLHQPEDAGRWYSPGNTCPPVYLTYCNNFINNIDYYKVSYQDRDGTLWRINTGAIDAESAGTSGFELVHHFRKAKTGKYPAGVINGPNGRLFGITLKGGGSWYSRSGQQNYMDDKGTIFMVGAEPEAVVTLTVTPAEALPGDKVEITWTSYQAQNCVSTSSAGDWTGNQPVEGSVDIFPPKGIRTYALVCTDIQTGLQVSSSIQTLRINAPATENDGNTVRYKEGGGSLSLFFILLLASAMFLRARPVANPA